MNIQSVAEIRRGGGLSEGTRSRGGRGGVSQSKAIDRQEVLKKVWFSKSNWVETLGLLCLEYWEAGNKIYVKEGFQTFKRLNWIGLSG